MKPTPNLDRLKLRLVEVWADFEQTTVVKRYTRWRKQSWTCIKAEWQRIDTCCDLWRRTVFESRHTVLNDWTDVSVNISC